MPFVNFVAGTQLTEANLDTMFRQTVMTFASAAARDSALSGVLAEGMVTYQNDTDAITIYNGSSWVTSIWSGAWSSYTPTLTGGGVGNGSVTGSYTQQGKTVITRGTWTLGSTSTFTSTLSVSLPITATGDGAGACRMLDNGTRHWPGVCVLATTTTIQFIHPDAANAGLVGNTAPFTWTTADSISWTFTYQAA